MNDIDGRLKSLRLSSDFGGPMGQKWRFEMLDILEQLNREVKELRADADS